jgi:Flp pilus assembly protein TadG
MIAKGRYVTVNKGPEIGADPERGSTLVEFGLVLIMMFAILFGIIDFGRALYTYHFVTNAAREGTRYAIVRGANCNNTTGQLGVCPAYASDVTTYVQNLAVGIGIDKNSLFVTPTWSAPSYSASNCTVNQQTGLYDNPGCVVQVNVQYAFKFIFPLMPTTTCQVGSPPINASICMTSTSQMVISQ